MCNIVVWIFTGHLPKITTQETGEQTDAAETDVHDEDAK